MKKQTVLLIFSCVLFLISAAQEQPETLQHTESWASLIKKARQSNKPIFIDCYFTGCLPCAQMDKEVFPNELVKKELSEQFISVKIDVFKEKLGDTINLKFGITGYPTFLILDPSGQLVSSFVGYNDAGLLLGKLEEAKTKMAKGELLHGYSAQPTDIYPDFYKKYFDREDRKSDPASANHWIRQQKDKTSEPAALAIFITRKLDQDIETFFLNNYSEYRNMFGETLSLEKAADILSARLTGAIKSNKEEGQFREFLKTHAGLFPKEDWRRIHFMLGFKYYGSMAKDTAALLQFINEDPLVYMNYMGALYNNMVVKKQLNDLTLSLLCQWAEKAVTPESSFDIIRMAANMSRKNNQPEGYKRFINMAISKSLKYKVPSDMYEKMLREG